MPTKFCFAINATTFLTRHLIFCFSLLVHAEGAAANATPNVVAEKGERGEKSSSNIEATGGCCDVDVGVHQIEVSRDEGRRGVVRTQGRIEARTH